MLSNIPFDYFCVRRYRFRTILCEIISKMNYCHQKTEDINSTGASFVTWCPCYVHVPFIILIMSAHSWVISPDWGKLCDMVSLLRTCTIHYPYYECTFLGHFTRLGQALWHGVFVTYMYHSLSLLWVHIIGSFHQTGASFVTWCLCYVHVPFIILIMSAHSWVISPDWGKALWHGVLVTYMYHSLSLLWVHILGSFHQTGGKLCDMVSLLRTCTIHYPYYECTFLVVLEIRMESISK